MKKNEKKQFWQNLAVYKKAFLLGLAAVLLGMFASCSDGGGGSSPSNKVRFGEYSAGTVLRNTVVSLANEADVYYEYLTFSSKEGGTYALYKKGNSKNTKITSYTDHNGKSQTVPTAFTYDSKTGKFSAGNVSSYLFEAADVAVIASELLTSESTEKTLYKTWKNAAANTFAFKKDGLAEFSDGTVTVNAQYEESDGWITLTEGGNIPFFYSSEANLYFLAYETEREQVESEGRSLAVANAATGTTTKSAEFDFISPCFLLLSAEF